MPALNVIIGDIDMAGNAYVRGKQSLETAVLSLMRSRLNLREWCWRGVVCLIWAKLLMLKLRQATLR